MIKFNVGDDLYEAGVDDEGKAYLDTWRVSVIRKGRVFMIQVAEGATIQKGVWMKGIPAFLKRDFYATGESFHEKRMFKSKAPALKKGIKDTLEKIAEADILDYEDEADLANWKKLQEKGITALKSRLTKEKNK